MVRTPCDVIEQREREKDERMKAVEMVFADGLLCTKRGTRNCSVPLFTDVARDTVKSTCCCHEAALRSNIMKKTNRVCRWHMLADQRV